MATTGNFDATSTTIPNIFDPQTHMLSLNMSNNIKLSSSNYITWNLQIHLFLDGHELSKFIHENPSLLPATITIDGIKTPNPSHTSWIRQDKLIFVSLLGPITTPLQPLVTRATTTSEAWGILSKTYGCPTRGNVKHIKDQLKKSNIFSKSIDKYMKLIMSNAYQLTLLVKTLDHEDLVEYILE